MNNLLLVTLISIGIFGSAIRAEETHTLSPEQKKTLKMEEKIIYPTYPEKRPKHKGPGEWVGGDFRMQGRELNDGQGASHAMAMCKQGMSLKELGSAKADLLKSGKDMQNRLKQINDRIDVCDSYLKLDSGKETRGGDSVGSLEESRTQKYRAQELVNLLTGMGKEEIELALKGIEIKPELLEALKSALERVGFVPQRP